MKDENSISTDVLRSQQTGKCNIYIRDDVCMCRRYIGWSHVYFSAIVRVIIDASLFCYRWDWQKVHGNKRMSPVVTHTLHTLANGHAQVITQQYFT